MSTDENGLRASKKRRTRDSILANAIALFRRDGIGRTRTSEIARAAEISQATLFNYFSTKDALAGSWVRGELAQTLDGLEPEVTERGIRPALRRACRELAGAAQDAPELRLEAWHRASRISAESQAGAAGLTRAIAAEQDRGRLRADLAPELLAEMVIEALEGGIGAGLGRGDEERSFARQLMARIDLVLDGARKKNERVVAPAGTARPSSRA
jgi:AcrR family transcriptional regulator